MRFHYLVNEKMSMTESRGNSDNSTVCPIQMMFSLRRRGQRPIICLHHDKMTIKGLDCTSFSQRYNIPSVSPLSTQTWEWETQLE